jgi:dGTPase
MSMDWKRLVSSKRLGRDTPPSAADARSEYLKDWDRIVYSSAFRRLQDKAQVFPLAESDYVRTRLTHSIEVASVGRSLGALCGEFILAVTPGLAAIIGAQDFGSIVAAACLAHDIGNPPFGHSGEDAIQAWFAEEGAAYLHKLTSAEQADLCRFEGNAQGFRLISRLQNAVNRGGFQLTHAVLAAFAKYPRGASMPTMVKGRVSEKKFGYVDDDAANFAIVAADTGLIAKAPGAWCRHPLAFLMEAADDICYGVVDLEDGHRLSRVSFEQVSALLWPIAFPDGQAASSSYADIGDDDGRVEYLRARAIGNLIAATVEVFQAEYTAIMDGVFESDLVSRCRFSAQLEAIAGVSRKQIYATPAVLQIEAAGFEIIGGLLGKLVPALLSAETVRSKAHKKIMQIVPDQFKAGEGDYRKLLGATDYVSGMTDTYALTLFRRLNGIELPGSSI